MSMTELLKELSLSFGSSGCEDEVAALIEKKIVPYADEIMHDKQGSLIALYKGNGSKGKLMISASMDEVGFMVKSVDGRGYIKTAPLGNKNQTTLSGRNVTILGECGHVKGYYGIKPTHLGGSAGDSYIDIGAADKAEAEKYIAIGDFGTYRSDFVVFGKDDNRYKGKALDTRMGCAALCEALRRLREDGVELEYDLYFTFTRRDMIGHSSAGCAAELIKPDAALVLGSAEESETSAKLGKGAAVSYMNRAVLSNRELVAKVIEAAKSAEIPHQVIAADTSSPAAGMIAKAAEGAKVATIAIPVRYPRTASVVIDRRDCDSAVALLMSAVKAI